MSDIENQYNTERKKVESIKNELYALSPLDLPDDQKQKYIDLLSNLLGKVDSTQGFDKEAEIKAKLDVLGDIDKFFTEHVLNRSDKVFQTQSTDLRLEIQALEEKTAKISEIKDTGEISEKAIYIFKTALEDIEVSDYHRRVLGGKMNHQAKTFLTRIYRNIGEDNFIQFSKQFLKTLYVNDFYNFHSRLEDIVESSSIIDKDKFTEITIEKVKKDEIISLIDGRLDEVLINKYLDKLVPFQEYTYLLVYFFESDSSYLQKFLDKIDLFIKLSTLIPNEDHAFDNFIESWIKSPDKLTDQEILVLASKHKESSCVAFLFIKKDKSNYKQVLELSDAFKEIWYACWHVWNRESDIANKIPFKVIGLAKKYPEYIYRAILYFSKEQLESLDENYLSRHAETISELGRRNIPINRFGMMIYNERFINEIARKIIQIPEEESLGEIPDDALKNIDTFNRWLNEEIKIITLCYDIGGTRTLQRALRDLGKSEKDITPNDLKRISPISKMYEKYDLNNYSYRREYVSLKSVLADYFAFSEKDRRTIEKEIKDDYQKEKFDTSTTKFMPKGFRTTKEQSFLHIERIAKAVNEDKSIAELFKLYYKLYSNKKAIFIAFDNLDLESDDSSYDDQTKTFFASFDMLITYHLKQIGITAEKALDLLKLATKDDHPGFIFYIKSHEQYKKIWKNRGKIGEILKTYKLRFNYALYLPLDLIESDYELFKKALDEIPADKREAGLALIIHGVKTRDDLNKFNKEKKYLLKFINANIKDSDNELYMHRTAIGIIDNLEVSKVLQPILENTFKTGRQFDTDSFLKLIDITWLKANIKNITELTEAINPQDLTSALELIYSLQKNPHLLTKNYDTLLKIVKNMKIGDYENDLTGVITPLTGIEESFWDSNPEDLIEISKWCIGTGSEFEGRSSRLYELYSVLPKSFFDKHRDKILELIKTDQLNPSDNAILIDVIDEFQRPFYSSINIDESLDILKRNWGKNIGIWKILPLLQYLKYPYIDKAFEECKKGRNIKPGVLEAWYFQFVTTDGRDNTNLLEFDYTKRETYSYMIDFFNQSGLTILSKRFLEKMTFGKFIKQMRGKTELEKLRILRDIGNNIDDRIEKRLMEKLFGNTKDSKWILTLGQWVNPVSNKIDVTQNNISDINLILSFIIKLYKQEKSDGIDIGKSLKTIMPACPCTGDLKTDISWLINQMDVEEINFNKLQGTGLLALTEFFSLISNLQELQNKSNTRFLKNTLDTMNVEKFFNNNTYDKLFKETIYKVNEIEKSRKEINRTNRSLGDQVINLLGTQFLVNNPASYENLPNLINFARAWRNPKFDRDVNELYNQFSVYAYEAVANFLSDEINQNGTGLEKIRNKMKKIGLSLLDIVSELEKNNFFIEVKESDFQKVISRISKHPSYTTRKIVLKTVGRLSTDNEVGGRQFVIEDSEWTKRNGVEVKKITINGTEYANLIKCDSKIGVKILANQGAMVEMSKERKELGDKFVFSAPVAMSTAQKMTEIAFKNGEQVSWLTGKKGGYVVVNSENKPTILNRDNCYVKELLKKEDFQTPAISKILTNWLRTKKNINQSIQSEEVMNRILDYKFDLRKNFADMTLFKELLKVKKYSLLTNMLLLDEDEATKLNDGNDSRRLFVTFPDGSFGIMDSTKDMSTDLLVELAASIGATRAVYMDTGMYDMASYTDGEGKSHLLGIPDTDESTNRVLFFEKNL